MTEMTFVLAADRADGIGYHNQLLYHLPTDLKHFQTITNNQIIIYGRKTLQTFPNQKPLKFRENWILTHQDIQIEGARIFHSIQEILDRLSMINQRVYVIGGASVYQQFLPECDEIQLTRIDAQKQADAFFTVPKSFQCVWQSDMMMENELSFCFETYRRTA